MGVGRFFRRGGRESADQEGDSGPREDEPENLADRAAYLSYSMGQMRPDEQRAAVLERLAELRAAGKVSEENFEKEKRRLMRDG